METKIKPNSQSKANQGKTSKTGNRKTSGKPNSKTNKTEKGKSPVGFIIVASVLVLIGAGYFYYLKRKQKKSMSFSNSGKNEPTGKTIISGPTVNKPTNISSTGFPLKSGSRGENVKVVQTYINTQLYKFPGFKPLTADGIWGSKTEEAARLIGLANPVTQDIFRKIVN